MRGGQNRATSLENGEYGADLFLSQNREDDAPMMVMQVYGPEYEVSGDFTSFWFGPDKARQMMNHLRAFLALHEKESVT